MRIEIENISEKDFDKVQQEIVKALLKVYEKTEGCPIKNAMNGEIYGFYFEV